MAKVVIDVLVKDLGTILSNLELTPNFAENVKCTLELDVIDSKENFETLIKSAKVINWDFITEENNEQSELIEDFSPKQNRDFGSDIANIIENPRVLEIFAYFDHQEFFKDKEGLLKLIFLAWNIKHKSPSRLFTLCSLSSTKHLESHTIKLNELAEYFPGTINKKLTDYYKDMPTRAILEDTIYKLDKIWNRLSEIQEFNNVIDEFLKL